MDYLKQIVLIVLTVAGSAGAAETFTDNFDFGSDGLLWKYESQAWTDNQSVTWIHTLAGFDSSATITRATLPITASGTDNVWQAKNGQVKGNVFALSNGQKLGLLKGSSNGFDVQGSQEIADSVANAAGFTKSRSWGNAYGRYNGTRQGPKYGDTIPGDGTQFPDLTDSKLIPPATVPAPSAVLLAGLGTAVVGLLRNRKSRYV